MKGEKGLKAKRSFYSVTITLALVFSLFWNYQQFQEGKKTVKETAESTKINEELKQKNSELKKSYESLVEQTASEKETLREIMTEQNNKGDNSEVLKEFDTRGKKLFETLYNFSPSNFKTIKNRVAEYITKDLLEQNFRNVSNTGDSYGTTSEMLSVNIYSKAVQTDEIKGIAIVVFEVTPEDGEPAKSSGIYEVTYDPASKKFTNYDFLGIGKTGDRLE